LVHEVGHAKVSLEDPDEITPKKEPWRSHSSKTFESGFVFSDAVFGGELLPKFGKSEKQKENPGFNDVESPDLFSQNLRFAPGVKLPGGFTKHFAQVNDHWVKELVVDTANGRIGERIKEKAAKEEIVLLPMLIHAESYKPVTPEEVQASCITRKRKKF
jgi:hypothetical protein